MAAAAPKNAAWAKERAEYQEHQDNEQGSFIFNGKADDVVNIVAYVFSVVDASAFVLRVA